MKWKEPNHDAQLPVAERIAYLIAGFLRGSLTEAEHNELDAWVVASEENTRLFEELTDEGRIEAAIDWDHRLDKGSALQKIKEEAGLRPPEKPFPRSLFPYLLAAVVLALVISIYLFTLKDTRRKSAGLAVNGSAEGVRSRGDQAVLTLASGRTIILDSSGSGPLATEGGVQVSKGAGGEIVYKGQGGGGQYHAVSIPRGGQYKLVLSDGTRVWLNAESSLRFPAGFTGTSREVELRGEAYFEVAKDAARPFRVRIRTPDGAWQHVEVLGTIFNIKAYGDDSIWRTTLLEGSVRVEMAGQSVVLRPGEQAQGVGELKVVPADLRKEVAWKDGLFYFRDATMEEIGSAITRWYDVEVEYRSPVRYHFNATIRREEPLASLLEVLEATRRVHFKWEGKKLIIEP